MRVPPKYIFPGPVEGRIINGTTELTEKKPRDDNESAQTVKVNRGKICDVTIYEIREDELDSLEQTQLTSVLFNIMLVLLSSGVSLLVTLLTVNISKENPVYYTILFLTISTLISGAVLGVVCYFMRNRKSYIISIIRDRMKGHIDNK